MFTINPYDSDFLNTLEFLLKLFAGIGGFILFFIGFSRYKKDQSWKRNEFVAKEIKEFTSDKMVQNTMYMLDWGTRLIELFPEKEIYNDRFVKIDRNFLKLGLQYHGVRVTETGQNKFTDTEAAIRDNFDHFLSYFERFEQFMQAGLITKKEIEPYLKYWINTIADDIEEDVRNVLFHYINQYNYTGTQALFQRFNKNILPTTHINSTSK